MKELVRIIALSRLRSLKPSHRGLLLEQYESVVPLFEKTGYAIVDGVKHGPLPAKAYEDIEREVETLEKMGVRIIHLRHQDYPSLLRNIPDPPLVLYQKGPLVIGENTLAMVGSRKATPEGIHLAERLSRTLSSLGITVISGFARGIDGAAHRGALKERGKTVAVLGCGMDICYPPEHRKLFQQIGEEGAILTEYGLGEKPLPHHFPERNRIIAGLSKGVLVAEAAQKSGSLITARLALEYGREVMAIPGNIFFEEHKGANNLIKEGARLIDSTEEILATCFQGLGVTAGKKEIDMNEDEVYIYSLIGFNRIHVNDIIEQSKMETGAVLALLTKMEMKEAISELGGGFWVRK
jgi:DNA processing protein